MGEGAREGEHEGKRARKDGDVSLDDRIGYDLTLL